MTIPAGIEAFVHVAEQLSFRGAATQLAVSPTAVSKAVARLEEELGVRLLNRTTRHVALTAEGATYLRHCREAIDRLQAGRDLVTRAAQVARGTLRVSLSPVLGRRMLGALPALLSRYPGLEVHLVFGDRNVGLVEEDVDVALRIGALEDSGLVARRLRSPRWVVVASPGYLARREPIREPADLAAHACLLFRNPAGIVAPWQFRDAVVVPRGPVVLDHGDLLLDAAVAGLGVARIFDFMIEEAVRRGDLVEILREDAVPGPPIHALCLAGRQRVPRIRAFLDFVAETF